MEHIFTLRYEDLVTQGNITVQEFCGFLNLKYEPMMLNISTKNSAYWQEKNQEGISSKYIDRWKSILSPTEKSLIQYVAGEDMEALSYIFVPVKLSSKLLIPFVLLRSGFDFFRRLLRRYRMGGRKFLGVVLLGYWNRLLKLVKAG